MNIEIFQKRRLFFLKYAARKPVAKNKNANIEIKNEKPKISSINTTPMKSTYWK